MCMIFGKQIYRSITHVDSRPLAIRSEEGVELKGPMELTKIKMLKEERDQKWSEAWKKVNSTGIESLRSSLPLYQCNASEDDGDDDDDDDDDGGGGDISFSQIRFAGV